MRHGKAKRKLGRTSSHRMAMFRNMLTSFMEQERIITTLAKAKELRPLAERCITRAKDADNINNHRWMRKYIPNRDVVKRVFDDIGPRFTDRPGGYTRITKIGPRQGDGAEMAVLELVDYEFEEV
jgi:large subunit ribosomal protein L17